MRPRTPRFVFGALALLAAASPSVLPAAADPIQPQGNPPAAAFNRLHPYEEVVDLLKGYAAAYPKWTKLESIGKTAQGRDLWMITINNPATGPELSKPAMYVDGNTHANEVQGAEAALYTVDYLLKNYGRLPRVTEIMDRSVFYILPVVNADGRTLWFKGPSDADFPRTVMQPVDDDRDGKLDEDGFDDVDGDGYITEMRKKVPMGQGTHRLDPKDPRLLVQVEPGELGDWIQLGKEGFDNDGDGRVNEDTIGYVDPNRTWGFSWEPEYVQRGAGNYPLAIPETRAIAMWALAHPNVAAVQSYHNNGRMILRGPGAKADPPYPPQDLKAYDLLGKEGEKLLPGYRYFISWKDLYTVHGGTTDHFYNIMGALAFTNEMYDPPADFDKNGEITQEELMKFNDLLSLGRQWVDWKPYKHPQYGMIEVGGFKRDVGRVPEGWTLEDETHRNNAFVLLNAYHLPRLSIGEAMVKKAGDRLWKVEVPVLNDRAIPSMTTVAVNGKLHRRDVATLTGGKVISSGIVDDPFLDKIAIQAHRPERLMVPGVEGVSTRTLFFLVQGDGEVTVNYDSLKGGKVSKKIALRETGM
ncbi:MAG TPA: M14 family metallopeptidase [Thermoanaerobaculia bacterium]|nr:M14 family metallopeptidase [Thermoanaerobaculia bacterium]